MESIELLDAINRIGDELEKIRKILQRSNVGKDTGEIICVDCMSKSDGVPDCVIDGCCQYEIDKVREDESYTYLE